uniref:hypothetical protein n=1 Tax=Burkholderia sp. AU33423 TaxID=2015355 RepID=UPI001180401F|nr:hypothetical protein [Burkholderia sp. AU33423]
MASRQRNFDPVFNARFCCRNWLIRSGSGMVCAARHPPSQRANRAMAFGKFGVSTRENAPHGPDMRIRVAWRLVDVSA